MMRHACAVLLVFSFAVLMGTGCTPPVEIGPLSDERDYPAERTAAGNVTAPVSAAEEAISGQEPSSPFIEVKNPLYNEDDPVLYDLGYEDNNDSCMCCHVDFKHELISKVHLEAGITCMCCHGDSEVHRADEFNLMPPDVVWGRREMEPFCKQCHPEHKHPDKVDAFMEEWESKRRPNGRWIETHSVCTDCHGEHAVTSGEGGFR